MSELKPNQSAPIDNEISFFRECIISMRPDDGPIFIQRSGTFIVRLNRYAILPIEEYEALLGGKASADKETWPCSKCGGLPTPDGHDPCIAHLPGVQHACCGHGKALGYAMFNDGRVIRGKFTKVASDQESCAPASEGEQK